MAVGSVLVRGGGALSILRPGAAYPGKLDDEAQWIPAERLSGRSSLALGKWSAPNMSDLDAFSVTEQIPEALRFTHRAAAADPSYARLAGGAAIVAERLANIAPERHPSPPAPAKRLAGKVNDESNAKTWQVWDNGKDGTASPITPEHAEMADPHVAGAGKDCSGPECALGGLRLRVRVAAYADPATRHPREAQPGDWKTIKSYSGLENGYPLQLWPNWMDFGEIP